MSLAFISRLRRPAKRGVVSFAFGLAFRLRYAPPFLDLTCNPNMTFVFQAIADAILSTEHLSIVQQVTKDEYGEEILTDYGNKEQPPQQKIRVPDNKSSPLPEYLDENDDLIFGVVIGDRALTKYGDKESGKGGGWFSGVSSFFSKTLYW